ncbi:MULTISPECIES: pheA operon leader peptide PheL [Klebsiella/Raoultella group]|uniref:PheA operon leader peptide PheL n=3 Tax=Klebsiella/Raoultella group TaxID=2890311 RepID=A0A9Q9JGD8_RAOOR|nr:MULTISPECIES: pheA operon leader peptide PheL [Klebsiella/Raoultella group]MDU4425105.1 pheA operon leader peptide PheL [Raoultella sp.]HDX8332738.1 pheA operon leader peptide PheL [Raoultella ornithinolytica CD1_MRS_4]EIY2678175.1 pheA operon leader peptide PheL [Raoultella planticola]EJD6311928.1 pheA operon leader peptide PheL [Raoultella ornithinolytica]EJD6654114.1 pheA operon leader peptide PheL [Raoultella ornithinolytica]
MKRLAFFFAFFFTFP